MIRCLEEQAIHVNEQEATECILRTWIFPEFIQVKYLGTRIQWQCPIWDKKSATSALQDQYMLCFEDFQCVFTMKHYLMKELS